MTEEAFIPWFAIPKPLLQTPKATVGPEIGRLNHTRRAMLLMLATLPLPAQADRTGKYSTKLTAKRRYLPRIARGVELIRRARNGAELDEEAMDDLFTAMELFATTYFSEGNRIGAREKSLSTFVEDGKKAFLNVKKGGSIALLVTFVNGYVTEAGLPTLAGVQPVE